MKVIGAGPAAIIALLASLLAMSIGVSASARAAESLDPSFGEGGISFPGLAGDIRGLAQDTKGKLVSAGGIPLYNFSLARYLRDGALDESFGEEGYALTPVGLPANAVAIQPDGRIVMAGSTESGGFTLVRYEADGTRRDRSFGRGKRHGYVITIAGYYGGGGEDVEVEPSGRILAAGYGIDFHHQWKAMLTAYRPNGHPDKRFGGDGIVGLQTTGETPIELSGVAALPNGRIVAAGDWNGYVMLLGLLADSRPDPRFGGGDGLVFTNVGPSGHCACAYATDMEIDRRGRIIVSANLTAPLGKQPAVLVRYRSNGELDSGFGEQGIARAALGSRLAGKAIALQHDGRIVLAGTYNVPGSGEARVAVTRFQPNGRLDRSFARAGFFTRDFGVEGVAYAALTQHDGRVVVGGRANPKHSPFPEDPSVYDTAHVFLIRFLPG